METDRGFRSGWRVGRANKMGPTLRAEGIYEGNIDSPYVMAEPSRLRAAIRAETLRGRHPFRTQPRTLSFKPGTPGAVNIDKAYRKQTVVGSAPPWAHGLGSDLGGIFFGLSVDDIKAIRQKVQEGTQDLKSAILRTGVGTADLKALKYDLDRFEVKITNYDKQYFPELRAGKDIPFLSSIRDNEELYYNAWASYEGELKSLGNRFEAITRTSMPYSIRKTKAELEAEQKEGGPPSTLNKLLPLGYLVAGAIAIGAVAKLVRGRG